MTSQLEQNKSTSLKTSTEESENKNNYRPSVPIYVYRQLVEELESTKKDLDTLKNQNQQLITQNQQLQEEVTKIIASAQILQDLLQPKIEISEPKSSLQPDKIVVETEKGSSTILLSNESSLPEVSSKKTPVEEHILEVEYTESTTIKDLVKKGGLSGVSLILLISFLVLSCFVGSFFVAKLLVNNNNNNSH